ncbi:Hsp20/alpha crystallin family protein [Chroogloeocystis siderophila]|uniref:Molecular chaperone n=1 Tax=Chroogloeocystis siderophila 5.2 s.c.1 TaxID=247279 RepID=A0A1U7HGG9_9CHRO|nr:Hsp20/alpha crystallin family protein [Chroogloeocystis siderophila]OKH22683.1 molecular chaperone [Chroogloeocystis siderophila 5.2 s.c.1]
MALVRWQPFQEIETLRRQMNELFDELVEFNDESRRRKLNWTPTIELKETDENVILKAEVPGVEGKDLDIQVSREGVSIAGEHRHEDRIVEQGYFRSEFRYGKFQRQINLPVPVKHDQVQAEFNNGILTLTMPKAEEARRRVVRLNLANSQHAIPAAESSGTSDFNQQMTRK